MTKKSFSEDMTINSIEESTCRSDELFLQGLFYNVSAIKMHEFIISSELIKGTDVYFSRENISKIPKKYHLWKGKNRKEKSWHADGSLKSADEFIGLVEFKGTHNKYLKHNDIAKLIQYLYYCVNNDKLLIWFCWHTMVDDFSWIYEHISKGVNKDDDFFRVCDTYTGGKSHMIGPSLREIKEDRDSIAPDKKGIDSYNPKAFKDFILDGKGKGENQKLLKEGFEKSLIVVDMNTENINKPQRNSIAVINLIAQQSSTGMPVGECTPGDILV